MITFTNVNSNNGSPAQLGELGAARAALRHPGMATLGGGGEGSELRPTAS